MFIKIYVRSMCTAKMVYGIIFILVGIWLLIPSGFFGMEMWKDLLILVKGLIPVSLVLIGIILVWIETEEKRLENTQPILEKHTGKDKKYKR